MSRVSRIQGVIPVLPMRAVHHQSYKLPEKADQKSQDGDSWEEGESGKGRVQGARVLPGDAIFMCDNALLMS